MFENFSFERGVEPKKMQIGVSEEVKNENGIHIKGGLKFFYLGDLKDGKPHGRGTTYFENGSKYTGNCQNGIKHGFGIFESKTINLKDSLWRE